MIKQISAAMMLLAGARGAALADAPQTAATTAGIAPFAAHYVAAWKDINIGTSDLLLRRDPQRGHYVYTWRISARGIFRLLYSHDVVQTSWFSLHDQHVRPEKYRADDASSAVSLNYDWPEHHARGTSEGKPLDLQLADGTQDVMSIQIEVMLDLKSGDMPDEFRIFDKNAIKQFQYTNEGKARIRTELGELDTVIVASQHAGSDRILRMWFAPALNYLPVKAERTRGGKLEFAMRISTLRR